MRRTLTALVLFSATLFLLQSIPQKKTTVVRRTEAQQQTMEQWVQTTVGDFEGGELDCLVLGAADGGEIGLAEEQSGLYCAEGLFTSEVHEMSVVFNVLGSAWAVEKPMGTSSQLELRVSSEGREWSAWMVVPQDEDDTGDGPLVHGNLLEVRPSRYIQYRLTLGTFDLALSPVLREVVITAMDTTGGPSVSEARAMIIPQESTSGVPQPRIISRKGWGANESWATREPVYEKPTHFVIHHTVTSNNPQDPAYIVRAIYQYHAISKGWGDIGYNFLIDRQGNIYEGRNGGDGVVGIHAGDYNYGSIGIALLGDYRTVDMTPAMKEALVSLMAWEADRFGINPVKSSYFVYRAFPNMVGHRDLWTTICPGDRVYAALPELRQLLWQRLLDHDPRVVVGNPEAGDAVSGEVQIRVSSPSPTTSSTRLLVDGTLKAEGESSLTWVWNTRQVSEGRHSIEAVAVNVEGRKARVAREVVVDNTPPVGSISLLEGAAYTSQLTVTLSLSADDVGSGIAGMQFTQNNASEFSPVEEFTAPHDWVLGEGDGRKVIGVRFLDRAGNASPTYTAAVVLDTDPPRDWSRVDTVDQHEVMVGVVDLGSGLDPSGARYSISSDGGFVWGAWEPVDCDVSGTSESLGSCYLVAEVSEGAVRFKIADRAGNEAYSPAYGEVVAPPTPESTPETSPQPVPQPTATPGGQVAPAELPDLVVGSVVVTPQGGLGATPVTVTVTLRNDGVADVADGFWVEFFVDPRTAPAINSVVGAEGHGVLWYVPSLAAGESRTLSLEGADARYTSFDGRLSAGNHNLYVYVDAYHTEGEVGLVVESDESNNLMGPLVVEVGEPSDGGASGPAEFIRLLIGRLEELLRVLRGQV
ncbi:MAG TPA: N-acetylmuramoyl-L-alanine amidase [Anaerolineae bacterium]|nr:N-acetylmuramoyl-L-alanine amidase [Anaerolineae bacterium]